MDPGRSEQDSLSPTGSRPGGPSTRTTQNRPNSYANFAGVRVDHLEREFARRLSRRTLLRCGARPIKAWMPITSPCPKPIRFVSTLTAGAGSSPHDGPEAPWVTRSRLCVSDIEGSFRNHED